MSQGKIFLVRDGQLVEINEEPYDSEGFLQRNLARFPDLLPGDQIDETRPRRWLLLQREAEVPGHEDGSGRWAVDHLFVDQEGVPTIVEVKRSSDTRIRRQVVGQMLEYAANATAYWDVADLRVRFEESLLAEGSDPDGALAEFLGDAVEVEDFWEEVGLNLDSGRVRMLFVADEIPDELKRIVEFLNAHMDRPEVLAVEVRHFVGEGQEAYVPRVHGKTARSDRRKSTSRRGSWDEENWLAAARAELDAETFEAVRDLYELSVELVEEYGGHIKWGSGVVTGTFSPIIEPLTPDTLGDDAPETSLYTVGSNGGFWCKYWFSHPDRAVELANRLEQQMSAIRGIEEAHDRHCSGPSGGIPFEKWLPVKNEIQRTIREFYADVNAESST